MPIAPSEAAALVAWVVLWGAVAGLVYRDAAPEGRPRAVAWTAVVFAFGVFGIIAYKATDWISFTRS